MAQIIAKSSWLCATNRVGRNLKINLFRILMGSTIPIMFLENFLICLNMRKRECVALVKTVTPQVKNMIVNCSEKLALARVECTGS